jgi:hypothetical protein
MWIHSNPDPLYYKVKNSKKPIHLRGFSNEIYITPCGSGFATLIIGIKANIGEKKN